MKYLQYRHLLTGLAIAIGLCLHVAGTAQSLTWLGTLGGNSSVAWKVSSFGPVVVGRSYNASGRVHAFRWYNGAIHDLGTLGGLNSEAWDVSEDGSVIVGGSQDSTGFPRAFRWTASTGMQSLGINAASSANAISLDGTVIVGSILESPRRSFRWRPSFGAEYLGTLGGDHCHARGASADGSVIVGDSSNSQNQSRAFRWVNGTMHDLGVLQGYEYNSLATAVSADGTVVVGASYNSTGQYRAFRWTPSNGMQNLGLLPNGRNAQAYDVSASGEVVVGIAVNQNGHSRAFRWTQQTGLQDLNVVYADLLVGNSRLERALGISPNGRYIVGDGYNAISGRYEAYLLDTSSCRANNGDVNANGCVDDADLLAVLFAFGQTGNNLGRVDTNCDGIVDDADLLTVLFNFGTGC